MVHCQWCQTSYHVPFTKEKLLESGGMTLYLTFNKWEVGVSYLNDQPSTLVHSTHIFIDSGDHGVTQRY